MTTYNIYCRETLDQPKTLLESGVSTKNYSVSGLTKGIKYLFSIGAVVNDIEKVSDEKSIIFGTPWTPFNMSSQADLYLDSENILTSDNQVTQMTDMSANGYHFTQSTPLYRPVVSFNEDIATNIVNFDGVNDYMSNMSAQVLSRNTNKFWFFTVCKKNSIDVNPTVNKSILSFNRGDAYEGSRLSLGISSAGVNANKLSMYLRPADSSSTSYNAYGESVEDDWFIGFTDWGRTSGSVSIYKDGKTSATGSGATSSTTNTQATKVPALLGCSGSWSGSSVGLAGYSDMSLACIIAGKGTLPTTEERQKLEGWAAHKYNLSDKLPLDHPYKFVAPIL